jgi:hypothetical protein
MRPRLTRGCSVLEGALDVRLCGSESRGWPREDNNFSISFEVMLPSACSFIVDGLKFRQESGN